TVHATRGQTMNPFKAALKQLLADRRKAGKVTAAKHSDEEVDKMSEEDAKAALKKCMEEEEAEAKGKTKAKASDKEEEEEEEKKAEASAQARITAQRKAEADEIHRCDEIKARCKRHGVEFAEVQHEGKAVKVNLAAHAIEQGWTPDAAELQALRC